MEGVLMCIGGVILIVGGIKQKQAKVCMGGCFCIFLGVLWLVVT
jgi:hypothetical protein